MSARAVRRQLLLFTAILLGALTRYVGRTTRSISAAILYVGLLYFAPCTDAHAQADTTQPPYSGYSFPWIELSGLPGSDTSAFGARAIAPLAVGDGRLFFLGLDGVLYDSGVDDWFQGNFGRVRNGGAYLGLRRYVNSDWIFGVWGGADAQNTLVDNTFGRFIGGLELYSDRWVLRLNGAAPFDDNNLVNPGNADRDEALPIRTALNRGFALSETAPNSIDGEAGIRFPFDLPGSGESMEELRFTLGAFRYFDVVDGVDLSGGRARGELDLYPFDHIMFGTRLTLEAEYEHDDRFDGRFMGGLRLAVPLGNLPTDTQVVAGKALPPTYHSTRNLFRPVRRDQDVVTGISGGGNDFIVSNTDVKVIAIAPVNQRSNAQAQAQGVALLNLSVTTNPVVLQGPAPFTVSVTATFTNTGNGPATNLIGNIEASTGDSGFGGTCGTSLAAGASCEGTFTTTFNSNGNFTIIVEMDYFDGTTAQNIFQVLNVVVTLF